MTPLGQARKLDPGSRVIANSGVARSPDHQIKHWVRFRAMLKQSQSRGRDWRQYLPTKKDNYSADLRDALGPQLYRYFLDSLAQSQYLVRTDMPGDLRPVLHSVFGSFQAQLGVILDNGLESAAKAGLRDSSTLESSGFPEQLLPAGLHPGNTLVWTYNFRRFSSITKDVEALTDNTDWRYIIRR